MDRESGGFPPIEEPLVRRRREFTSTNGRPGGRPKTPETVRKWILTDIKGVKSRRFRLGDTILIPSFKTKLYMPRMPMRETLRALTYARHRLLRDGGLPRGDRAEGPGLGAQAGDHAQPDGARAAVQRTPRAHGDLPELPRADPQRARRLRRRRARRAERGAARRGRIPPHADGGGPVRRDRGRRAVGGAMADRAPGAHGSRSGLNPVQGETMAKSMMMQKPRDEIVEDRPKGCPNCDSTSLFFDPVRSELVC